MGSIRLYVSIYVVLLALALSKYVFFLFGLDYWTMFSLIMVSAVAKTVLIAEYYQHLKHEPRSVSYVMLSSVFAVLLLAVAAAYSIS